MKIKARRAHAEQVGLYRVRHTKTALYVAMSIGHVKRYGEQLDTLSLFLDREISAVKAKRAVAGKLADVWIALTGDHGIEIEPVEG